jgi:hypothetical protein
LFFNVKILRWNFWIENVLLTFWTKKGIYFNLKTIYKFKLLILTVKNP